MRLYGGKAIRTQVDRRVSARSETRDAVLWDIDSVNQICRVKIQGSSNLITAHFPRNWKTTPYWLKRGNAVSVRHRSGVRGYVEVVGEGRAIPSPVSGGAQPDPSPLADGVITGCQLFATDPASMNILATGGTYRIGGMVYVFDPQELTVGAVIMDDPPPMTMGSGTVMMMGTSFYTITLDAAPAAGYFRYDLCYVGTDGVLTYVAGTPAARDPVKPTLPAKTVMIGQYILVIGGRSAIENYDIGSEWTVPYVSSMSITCSETHPWVSGNPTTTLPIVVVIVDQYGNPISISAQLQLDIKAGTGQVYSDNSGWNSTTVFQILSGSSYTFIYKRDQDASELSPVFLLTLLIQAQIMRAFKITLLDVNGDPIY